MELPVVGDIMSFSYPDDPYFSHHVYDDFPYGNVVHAYEAFVDFDGAVVVEEVREYWPRTRRRRGPPQEDYYVGARFTSVNGTVLWTNYAKNGEQWMHIWQPASPAPE